MCCLRYEEEAYEGLVKAVPKNGAFVETPAGFGTVTQVNILRGTVKVRLDGEGEAVFKNYSGGEVAVVPGGRPKNGEAPAHVLQRREEPETPETEDEPAAEPVADPRRSPAARAARPSAARAASAAAEPSAASGAKASAGRRPSAASARTASAATGAKSARAATSAATAAKSARASSARARPRTGPSAAAAAAEAAAAAASRLSSNKNRAPGFDSGCLKRPRRPF